jgi:hypothetical protein
LSHAELLVELELVSDVVSLPVTGLVARSSFRAGGLCSEQVDRFVESGGSWPPILVSRADGVVIDGAHRAARRLGMARVEAVQFDGGPEAAFVEFVRRNVSQGLALTLEERKRAAARVLRAHPVWSDRRVAELCALSPKTVARLRTEVGLRGLEPDSCADGGVREGRDHRLRPARRGSVRPRVVDALRAHPDASLRTIAAEAGVSPETVRLVRLNLAQASETELPEEVETEPSSADVESDPSDSWRSDAALRSSARAADLLGWFERTAIGEPDLTWVDEVPLSRVYVVADEARRRSQAWLDFARALEARSNCGR